MAQTKKNVAARVESAIKEPLLSIGYGIWDVDYVKEGSEWYLRVTIDRDDGVNIDDCEKALKLIDPIIDELDPVETAYHLEVSSPGLERELRTPDHFRACIGQTAKVKLFTALDGKKELLGVISDVYDDGSVKLLCPEEYVLEKNRISRANIYFDFDALDDQIDEN